MKITKAVIPLAGYSTRWLPITKTINKGMLPILNRPLVDYIVADCVAGGITEIIFVISDGDTQIKDYYSEKPDLGLWLQQHNKSDSYDLIADLPAKAHFHFVVQSNRARKYGTAVPVGLAREYIKNEPFMVLMGDDFVYRTDGGSEIKDMIDAYDESGAAGLVAGFEVPLEQISRYGVFGLRQERGYTYLERLVEKPLAEGAPSRLANIGKYILTPEIFAHIEALTPDVKSGEYYLTDAMTVFAQQLPVLVYQIKGQYLDGGTLEGWLNANQAVARDVLKS